MKQFILCADDYGLNSAVTDAILELVTQQRLSAVSCMMNHYCDSYQAHSLAAIGQHINIGLHFNLTEGLSLSKNTPFSGLNHLLVQSLMRRLSIDEIIAEFQKQLNTFCDYFGCFPDFIDGHQHVHQFPQINRLFDTLKDEYPQFSSTWWRCTQPATTHHSFKVKSIILGIAGAKQWRHRLQANQWPSNPSFAGIYDFKPSRNYRQLMQYWLTNAPNNTLIMCHPSQQNLTGTDAIVESRYHEYQYLMSSAFIDDTQKISALYIPGKSNPFAPN